MDSYEVVLDYFTKSGEPVNASKIAADTGVDKKEVDKVMKKLKQEEKIVSPKRCYWEIKK